MFVFNNFSFDGDSLVSAFSFVGLVYLRSIKVGFLGLASDGGTVLYLRGIHGLLLLLVYNLRSLDGGLLYSLLSVGLVLGGGVVSLVVGSVGVLVKIKNIIIL